MVLAVSQVVLVVGHGDRCAATKEGRGGRSRMKMSEEGQGPLKDDDENKTGGRSLGDEGNVEGDESRLSSWC